VAGFLPSSEVEEPMGNDLEDFIDDISEKRFFWEDLSVGFSFETGSRTITRTVVNAMLVPTLLGLLEVKATFPNPTFIGDTLKVLIEVSELKETSKMDRGLVRFKRSAVNQRGETVCVCDVLMLIQRRPKL